MIENNYLRDTEYAVKSLIQVIVRDNQDLTELKTKRKSKEIELNHLKASFSEMENSDDYDELKLQFAYQKVGKANNEKVILMLEIDKLKYSIENKKISLSALSMSILQIARQGISAHKHYTKGCNKCRKIAGVSLCQIIWEARNQSIHHEKAKYEPAQELCFQKLNKQYRGKFDLISNPKKNFAYDVLELLEWINYDKYVEDMKSILSRKN